MVLEVYIGKLNDPEDSRFSWENGDWSGNIPKVFSPYFPSGHWTFDKVLDIIRSGKWEGKQLDWGSWGIKMSKADLQSFILTCEAEQSGDCSEILHFVQEQLRDHETYVLVAMEGA